jgi:hypothetical protein
MIRVILLTVVFLTKLLASAQVSENRQSSNFSKLKVSETVEVFYTVSNITSIKVETDDNERLKLIKTEVEGETLKIFVDTKNTKKPKAITGNRRTVNGVSFNFIKVYVTGSALTEIKSSSSASIKIQNLNTTESLVLTASSSGSISGSFDCSDFKADVSSSADIKGRINAKSVFIEVSSSGDITLDGKATSLEVKASSSSNCNLKDVAVDNAIVKASSSADVTVTVAKSLDAVASSSADINYFGNPAQLRKDKSSSGLINKN